MRYKRLSSEAHKHGPRLAKFLNEFSESEKFAGVQQLVDDVDELWSLWRRRSRIEAIRKRGESYVTGRMELLRGRIERQWLCLVSPQIFCGFDGSRRLVFARGAAHRDLQCPPAIAEALEALGREGLFDRLRKCRQCNRWLFAKKDNQWSCSSKCRIDHYWSDPKHQQEQRERMSARYWQQKEFNKVPGASKILRQLGK
jgi:hypothetical protein